MARYYFDVIDGGRLTCDLFGVDLADDDEARDEAIALLHDLPRDRLPTVDQHQFVTRARNEGGEVVYEASLTLHGSWRPRR